MSQNKLLAEYAALESEYKKLEAQRELMRARIVETFVKDKIEKVEDDDLGSFTLGHRLIWTYSKAVKTAEEKIKILKVREQEKGKAKSTETNYLVYKEND